jgi:peptide/nickel transport system permease protein
LRRAGHLARRKPLGAVSVAIISAAIVVAVLADVLAAHNPTRVDGSMVAAAPGKIARDGVSYFLGGDELGRDLLSRVIYGARISLSVSFVAVAFGTAVGTLIGILSAYFLGNFDLLVQRVMDAQQAIPGLLFAMLLVSVFPPSIWVVVFALGFNLVPGANRVVRGAALSIKESPYIEAARAIGCSGPRIMLLHILPNVAAPIVVIATTSLGAVIISEAALSFLGFGVPLPTPSWGGMISAGGRQHMLSNPLIFFVPALALGITVLAFNLAGDALRDLWDPKLRRIE